MMRPFINHTDRKAAANRSEACAAAHCDPHRQSKAELRAMLAEAVRNTARLAQKHETKASR